MKRLSSLALGAVLAAAAGSIPCPAAPPAANPAAAAPANGDKPASPERDREHDRERNPDARRDKLKDLTPEQREAKRKEWRLRLEKQVADLKKKRDAGPLSEPDKKRLASLEKILARWEAAPGPAGPETPKPAPKKAPAPAPGK